MTTQHSSGAAVPWLVAGIAAGACATLGVGLLVMGAVRGDTPTAAMDPPQFVEQAESAGVDHVYDGEFTYFVGGGVGVLDCNDDGWSDLYLAGGVNPASLYRNESAIGEIAFAPVDDETAALTGVTGAYPIDIDSDGITDLAVLRLGENVVLKGLGDCRFERANEEWSIDGGDQWTVAFSATWEGDAVLPTLAFGNYVELSPSSGEQTGRCSDHMLLRPSGRSYGDPTNLSPGWCTLSVLFSDWGRSGQRDLRTTNDRHYYRDGEEQLWKMAAGQPPRLYTHEEGWERMQIWGMGIASHDVTGDGLPEVFLTSQGDNKLQTLSGGPAQPTYEDIAFERGVTAHRPHTGDNTHPSTAWHPEFADINNDRLIDLFVSKGNVEAQPDYAEEDPSNLLLGQPDGTFVESAPDAGLVDFARGRGAALVDLDLDGMLDLVEVMRREPVRIWHNVGWGNEETPQPMGNWVQLRAAQPAPNVDAIGAFVTVRANGHTVERELNVGGGHAGGQLGWLHFGLGDAERAEVRVQWPNGEVGPWMDLSANGFSVIERGAAEAIPWTPR
ncbi:MAG TPA: CRTAC1 family protein [Acidimicrobiia bacterium]|nr:CRTAC1 family protein [Acidimicrobiia bacterium]